MKKEEHVFIKYSHKDPMIPARVIQDDGMSAVLEKTDPKQVNQHRRLRVHKRHIWRANQTVTNSVILESVYNVFTPHQGENRLFDPEKPVALKNDRNCYSLWNGENFEMEWETWEEEEEFSDDESEHDSTE